MNNWISVEDKYPKYGKTILIVVNGVTQNLAYFRDGSDDSEDWCEPCQLECDDIETLWWSEVQYWQYLPEAPKGE